MAKRQSLDVDKYQTRLQELRSQIEADLEHHRQGSVALGGGPDEPGPGQHWEHSGYGDHQADDATELFEREKSIGLEQTLQARLAQVEHALARLGAGTYGTCERCGRPIDKGRLDALPEATLCIDCKSRTEEALARGRHEPGGGA